MKGFLITMAWLLLWGMVAVAMSSCMGIPPSAAMGDGATKQLGLINVTNHTMGAPPPRPPRPIMTVMDNGSVIQYPNR